MNPHQALIIRTLENAKGDDLYRARAAFRNCTPEQMQQEYGESGLTRAQVLQGYEAYEKRFEDAIAWVKSIV